MEATLMRAWERPFCGSLRAADVGRRVELVGWVRRRRNLGGIVFVDLRDREGWVQVLLRDELREAGEKLSQEDVIRVVGTVAARSAETVNPEMPTGEVEVEAEAVELLTAAETPPFVVEDRVNASEELRLRYRYLDLRRPEMMATVLLRDRIVYAVREYFHEMAFVDVETPILTRSTPEGARDFLVPSRLSRGTFYALPQSPQLFKQLLQVAGLGRYVQIARCFRDEDLRADRQLEFTQVDVEASFVEEEDIFTLIEGLFAHVFPIVGITPPATFPRLTFDEAMERFGTDRPDTRFGMELVELGEAAKACAFEGVAHGCRERAREGAGGARRRLVLAQAARRALRPREAVRRPRRGVVPQDRRGVRLARQEGARATRASPRSCRPAAQGRATSSWRSAVPPRSCSPLSARCAWSWHAGSA